MRKGFSFAAWLLIASFSGADPEDPALAAKLKDIIHRLDAEEAEDRDKAQLDLDAWCEAVGPGAAARLAALEKDASPEVVSRLREERSYLKELEEARKFLSVFDEFGMKSVRGLEFGRMRTEAADLEWNDDDHKSWVFPWIEGWKVEGSESHTIFWGANLRRLKLEHEWKPTGRFLEKDAPALPRKTAELPGCWEPEDFTAACRTLLDPARREWAAEMIEGTEAQSALSRGELPWYLVPALYARWCLDRGEGRTALALLAAARADIAARIEELGGTQTADEAIVSLLSRRLRYQVLLLASDGAPREDLLRVAEAAAARNFEDVPAVAELPKQLRSLLDEDLDWKEPTPAEFAALPPVEQARVWIHRLRDYGDSPDDIGMIDALVALDWEALPAIVPALTDRRPTRMQGGVSEGGPLETSSVSIGELAESAFWGITTIRTDDKSITSVLKVQEGEIYADFERRRLALWWEQTSARPKAEHFRPLAEAGSYYAATALLKIDAKEWLPVLRKSAALGGAQTMGLLPAMEPFLEPEDAGWMGNILEEADPHLLVLVSGTLSRKFNDRRGIDVMARKLKNGSFRFQDHWPHMLLFLSEFPGPDTWAAYAACVSVQGPQCFMLTPFARAFASRPAAEAWGVVLDSREPLNSDDFSEQSLLCDIAASSLSAMTGYTPAWNDLETRENRDAWIAEFKKWWGREGKTFDWEERRKQIAAEEKK